MLRLLFSGFIQEIVLRFSSDRQKETCAEQFRMMQRIIFKEQMFQITTTTTPLSHCFVKVWCYFPTVVLRQWVIDSHPDTWPIKLVWPWTLFPPATQKLTNTDLLQPFLCEVCFKSIRVPRIIHYFYCIFRLLLRFLCLRYQHMECMSQMAMFGTKKTIRNW